MKNKEVAVISAIILVSVVVLFGLFFYQKGQITKINQTIMGNNDTEIVLHEAVFRPSNTDYENIIIKADLVNKKNETNYLRETIKPPTEPSICYNYNYSDYKNYYSNDINININSQNVTTSPVSPRRVEIPQTCLNYYKEKDEYNTRVSNMDSDFDKGKFRLYTPSGAIAETDYSAIGGKNDLYSLVNSPYQSLQPNETINGVFVFKLSGQKSGTYRVTYQGNEISFEVK